MNSPREHQGSGARQGNGHHNIPGPRRPIVRQPIYVVQCSSVGDEPLVNELEEKLLTLALDKGARGNEVDTSAVKLIGSWRKRGVTPQELLEPLSRAPARRDQRLEAACRRVMPFGRHRGRQLQAIEPSYLKWALRECSNLSLGLREAIESVLERCGSAKN